MVSSKYRGVRWASSKWRADIKIDNRKIYLGHFTYEDDAARAYDKAAIRHDGFRAQINFRWQNYDNILPPLPEAPEGAQLIPLTRKQFAIVDADMFEELSRWKWHTLKAGKTYYAARDNHGEGPRKILMHRVIMNCPDEAQVDHIHGKL